MVAPDISVVVPVYNGERTLDHCLTALENQRFSGKLEIIVVDNGSTDASAAIARRHRSVHLTNCHKIGPAAARNAGVRVAHASLIAFTDADCVPEPSWVAELERGLTSELAGVGGPLISARSGAIQDLVAEISFDQKAAVSSPLPYLATANALFRRSALHAVGGFDETFPIAGGEDNDLGWRLTAAGQRLGYVLSAICLHQHPQGLLDFAAQRVRYGFGEQVLLSKHGEVPAVRELCGRSNWTRWRNLCRLIARYVMDFARRPNSRPVLLALGEAAFFTGGIAFLARRAVRRSPPVSTAARTQPRQTGFGGAPDPDVEVDP